MHKTIRVVEQRDVEREYGFGGVEAIIDHSTHGRLYIADGFGGMDPLGGGCVRWRHGIVCGLKADDDLDALDEWHSGCTVHTRMLAGYDTDRVPLDWPGRQISALAAASGLV